MTTALAADCNPSDMRNSSDDAWSCFCVSDKNDPRYSPTGGVDRSTCNVTGAVDVRKRYCGPPSTPPAGGLPACAVCADDCGVHRHPARPAQITSASQCSAARALHANGQSWVTLSLR